MKILASILIVLLLACVVGAAFFYIYMYQPILTDYAGLQSGKTEFEKTKTELRKYKEKEKSESAWVAPALADINAVLSDEIKSGKAEAVDLGNRIVINITEQSLYMSGSKLFSNDSTPLRAKLDSLFRNASFKNKNIYIGNTTQEVSAQTIGRKKVPAKDARTLAAERSMEFVKYLEKKGVSQDALIAVAYSSKQADTGFKIKERKTIILVENPIVAPPAAPKQEAVTGSKQTPTTTSSATPTASSASQVQSKQSMTVKPAPTATPTDSSASQPKPVPIRPQPK
jgi:hypothetical protein